jgi:hypothetical protein
MILALAASLMVAHGDLPSPPMEVSQAVRTWRDCVFDGLNRRTSLTRRGEDPYELASTILAECRPQQEAAFTARSQWVEGLELSPEAQAVVLRRNERDVRSLHDSIIFRARRSASGSEQDWE